MQFRRLVFLGTYLSSLVARREAMLADFADHPTWRSAETLHDIIRTAVAIVEVPAS